MREPTRPLPRENDFLWAPRARENLTESKKKKKVRQRESGVWRIYESKKKSHWSLPGLSYQPALLKDFDIPTTMVS